MNTSEIKHYIDILRRRWVVVFCVCLAGVLIMPLIIKQIPIYQGHAELLIVSEALKDTTQSEPDLPTIITSTEVLSRVINNLKLGIDAGTLAKRIKTKLPPKSSLLDLSYKDTDSVTAARVANAIADEAVVYYHDIATNGYSQVIDALNEQIAQSRVDISNANKKLGRASANGGFATSDKALDELTSEINDLQAARGQIKASLSADLAAASGLRKQSSDIAPIVRGEILQKDLVYQSVQTNVARDVADLVSERSSFKDSFPGLAALAKRVARERGQADETARVAVAEGAGESASQTQTVLDTERADTLVEADRKRLSTTEAEISAQQKHLKQVAGAGAAVSTLSAERDAAQQQYMSLTQRLSAAEGDAAQAASLGSLIVVSRATPGGSNLLFYIIAMCAATLIASIIAVFVSEVLDKRFWDNDEIESLYRRPVLLTVGPT